jgi:hypothetical protein
MNLNVESDVYYCAGFPRISSHIFNIFTEKISRVRRVLFSSHDSGTAKVLRTIFVLSSVHECAHASVSEHLNAGLTLYEQQREFMSKCSEVGKELSE